MLQLSYYCCCCFSCCWCHFSGYGYRCWWYMLLLIGFAFVCTLTYICTLQGTWVISLTHSRTLYTYISSHCSVRYTKGIRVWLVRVIFSSHADADADADAVAVTTSGSASFSYLSHLGSQIQPQSKDQVQNLSLLSSLWLSYELFLPSLSSLSLLSSSWAASKPLLMTWLVFGSVIWELRIMLAME